MPEFRPALGNDLRTVASWIDSAEACRLWCGTRVGYPIDLALLPDAIEFGACESWAAEGRSEIVAFGQLVSKPLERLHLARIISDPDRRGEGHGREISAYLLDVAREQRPSVVSLNVFAENAAAIALYHSLGFVRTTRPETEPASESVYMECVVP